MHPEENIKEVSLDETEKSHSLEVSFPNMESRCIFLHIHLVKTISLHLLLIDDL